MKKFATILAAFLPLCNLIAQTYLTQSFGTTKTQVQEFLKTRKLLNVTEGEDHCLQVSSDAYTVKYYFEEGKLYKMETLRDFGTRREANEALANLREQQKLLQSTILELGDDKELTRFAARHGGELNEVSAYSLTKNHAQLRVMNVDLKHTPNEEMAELRQMHALFALAQK